MPSQPQMTCAKQQATADRTERAFELFTAHIRQWWPLAAHSDSGWEPVISSFTALAASAP